MRFLQYLIGGTLAAVGFVTLLYGGYLAATVEADGSTPNSLAAWVICIAGVAGLGVGAWLCGDGMDRRN